MGMSFVNFVFRLKVTFTMLINAFSYVGERIKDLFHDWRHWGVLNNINSNSSEQLLLTANSPADMEILCQPGVAITPLGVRCVRAGTATDKIDCSVDKNGDPTIPSVGQERYIAIDILPNYETNQNGQPSPVDGHGNAYDLNHIVSHKFEVVAGAEAAPGNAVIPSKSGDAVRLGTILLDSSTTAIVNAASSPYSNASTVGEISYSARETWDKTSELYGYGFSARQYLDVRTNLGTSSNPGGSKLYAENFPRAWANIVGATGAVSGSGKYNIASTVRDAVGRYTIELPAGFFTSADTMVVMATSKDSSGDLEPNEVRAWAQDGDTIKVEIVGDDTGWSYKDIDFSIVVFGRPADSQLSPRH